MENKTTEITSFVTQNQLESTYFESCQSYCKAAIDLFETLAN